MFEHNLPRHTDKYCQSKRKNEKNMEKVSFFDLRRYVASVIEEKKPGRFRAVLLSELRYGSGDRLLGAMQPYLFQRVNIPLITEQAITFVPRHLFDDSEVQQASESAADGGIRQASQLFQFGDVGYRMAKHRLMHR